MSLIEHPAEGEGTLISFYSTMAQEVGTGGREVLNHIAQALLERGWLPTVDALIEQLSEIRKEEQTRAILDDLIHRRLVTLDDSGTKVCTFLGSISVDKTPHHARLDSGTDLYFLGAIELLAAGPLFGVKIDATTVCAQTGKPITLSLEDDVISAASPSGLAGFQASWDGKASLETVYEHSNLFVDDEALDAWVSEHEAVDGLPLSGDLLLFIGMGMAQETGNARYKMIGL
jgi:hypothetical protein